MTGRVDPIRSVADFAEQETTGLEVVVSANNLGGSEKAAVRVIANFKQVVKGGSLKLHPLVTRLVDEDTLKKMGAERMGGKGERE